MTLPTTHRSPGSRLSRGRVLDGLVGILLGGAILGWVACHAGPPTGTAVVHVTEPNVEVAVGGHEFEIGATRSHAPLVCELPAGEHRLTMTRDGEVLHSESFTMGRGGSRVLTAHAPPGRERTPIGDLAAAGGIPPSVDHRPPSPAAEPRPHPAAENPVSVPKPRCQPTGRPPGIPPRTDEDSDCASGCGDPGFLFSEPLKRTWRPFRGTP